MEAFVWASTDSHLGVAISTRVFGSVDEAKADANEAVGDAVQIVWEEESPDVWRGDFVDTNGSDGVVRIDAVKVNVSAFYWEGVKP